jgi:hypothetical protein
MPGPSLLRLRRHVLRQVSRDLQRAWSARRPPDIAATGADTLLAGDLGCLLNMAGKLQREGSTMKVRHVAEVLAGMGDLPRDRRAGAALMQSTSPRLQVQRRRAR